jgi:hypothetical protein
VVREEPNREADRDPKGNDGERVVPQPVASAQRTAWQRLWHLLLAPLPDGSDWVGQPEDKD